MTTEKCAYTVKDFGEAFSIGQTKIYAEIKSGRLKARKFGTKSLITKGDADAWLESLPFDWAVDGESDG
jgi:excisionase family DNA binding protein